MDTQFEQLSRLLEEEVARQETQLALCQAQYRAIRANDIEYLEAKAADIEAVNRAGDQAERTRQRIVEAIVDHYRIPSDGASLEALAGLAPEPYQSRLRTCAERIKAIQNDMRHIVLSGVDSLQRTATVIVQCINAFKGCVRLVPDPLSAQPAQPASHSDLGGRSEPVHE